MMASEVSAIHRVCVEQSRSVSFTHSEGGKGHTTADIRLVDYPGSRDVEIEVNSYRVLLKYWMLPQDLQQVKRRRAARLPSIVTWG